MLVVKSIINVRDNFKEWCDEISVGKTVIISRPRNESIYMINEAESLAMLDESQAQFERGDTISFSMEELRAMKSDDWKPMQKVLDFKRKHGIKRPGVTNNK